MKDVKNATIYKRKMKR